MGFRQRARDFTELKAGREERDAAPEDQWEYLAFNLRKTFGPALEQNLCEFGLKGWELVCVVGEGKEGYATFKRRLPAG